MGGAGSTHDGGSGGAQGTVPPHPRGGACFDFASLSDVQPLPSPHSTARLEASSSPCWPQAASPGPCHSVWGAQGEGSGRDPGPGVGSGFSRRPEKGSRTSPRLSVPSVNQRNGTCIAGVHTACRGPEHSLGVPGTCPTPCGWPPFPPLRPEGSRSMLRCPLSRDLRAGPAA